MTKFQGFKTKEEAKAFQREHGGLLCWDKRSPRTGKPIAEGIEYDTIVHAGGLDPNKWPYALYWRNV